MGAQRKHWSRKVEKAGDLPVLAANANVTQSAKEGALLRNILASASLAVAAIACLPLSAHGQTYTYRVKPGAEFVIPPSNVLAISSPDNHCPVEPHPKAINPEVVECHAAFAPLPAIPPLRTQTTPEQREAAGKWLVDQLNQPGVCAKDEKVGKEESCALLIYNLRKEDRIIGIPVSDAAPWIYVVKIYRISHPTDGGNVMLYTVDSNDGESQFGTVQHPMWELLAEHRVAKRCIQRKTNFVGMGISSSGMRPDSCTTKLTDDWRYEPTLLLPHSKAKIVLNKSLTDTTFDAPPFVVQSVEDVMRGLAGG